MSQRVHITEFPIFEQTETGWCARYPERDWCATALSRAGALAALLAEEERRDREDPNYSDEMLQRLLASSDPRVKVRYGDD